MRTTPHEPIDIGARKAADPELKEYVHRDQLPERRALTQLNILVGGLMLGALASADTQSDQLIITPASVEFFKAAVISSAVSIPVVVLGKFRARRAIRRYDRQHPGLSGLIEHWQANEAILDSEQQIEPAVPVHEAWASADVMHHWVTVQDMLQNEPLPAAA